MPPFCGLSGEKFSVSSRRVLNSDTSEEKAKGVVFPRRQLGYAIKVAKCAPKVGEEVATPGK